MNHKFVFLKKILPADICPKIYDDVTLDELTIIDLFINEVYEDITENNEIAALAAVKFWLYKKNETKISLRLFLDLMKGICKYMKAYKNHEAIAFSATAEYYYKYILCIPKK